MLKQTMEGSGLYYSAHAIAPAGSSPWAGRTSLAGEYHVFAIGYDELGLDVRGADGYAAAQPSIYVRVAQVTSGGYTTSRVLHANALEKFSVKVSGKGCALMGIFRAQ